MWSLKEEEEPTTSQIAERRSPVQTKGLADSQGPKQVKVLEYVGAKVTWLSEVSEQPTPATK